MTHFNVVNYTSDISTLSPLFIYELPSFLHNIILIISLDSFCIPNCLAIKQDQSEVGSILIDCEVHPEKGMHFFCFLLS